MISEQAAAVKNASITLAALSTQMKNDCLAAIARALAGHEEQILQANQADLGQAEKDRLTPVLMKRLKFDQTKLQAVIEGIEQLIRLPDPVGQTLCGTELDKGLELYKVTCPIGVLCIIFESRPDALVQISTLALKSGNAVLLKGGSEAAQTNRMLAQIIIDAGIETGLPEDWMVLLETREDVKKMLAQDQYIDLVVPRGSNEFVKYIMDNTRIMVLGHADGICHVYVDEAADLEKAAGIAFDSKCQYPAVCNAMETLLVHEVIASDFLPRMKTEYDRAGVELRCDQQACRIIEAAPTSEADWDTEYNDLILSIKVVRDLDAAVDHINQHGSHHTDAIVTEDEEGARRFLDMVDSANVFWNCSTRYADGFRYGLGAEVGISTHKVHARGPVGMEGLVIYKWKLIGQGHIVADYASGQKKFIHRDLAKDFPR